MGCGRTLLNINKRKYDNVIVHINPNWFYKKYGKRYKYVILSIYPDVSFINYYKDNDKYKLDYLNKYSKEEIDEMLDNMMLIFGR